LKGTVAPVRVGVIGCGVIAYWVHLRLLRNLPGARLVTASDPDAQARARARRLVKIPIVENSADIFNDANVDAVVICGPTDLHADLAIDACNAGKHVFLEKPIATSAADSARVLAAAEKSGVTATVGFNRRLHPMFEQAREMIVSGEIGRVHAVQTAFCEPMDPAQMGDWRKHRSTGGGALLDLASHHVDLLRWFLNDEIECVEATIASEQTEHDSATLSLDLAGGAKVQSFFSFRTARTDFLEFIGEKATLRVDRHRSRLATMVNRRFGYGIRSHSAFPTANVATWRMRRLIQPSKEPSYRRSLLAFIDAIHGAKPRFASFADGARSLDVILAAEESSRIRAPVTLRT
jgi:myo-inositol 2-dehydrogenase/D-chiro-inositol 1-dehydrogenase